MLIFSCSVFFFFNDTATTEIYTLSDTLSLHDALPILPMPPCSWMASWPTSLPVRRSEEHTSELQSPLNISYAVFCLKKKKKKTPKYITEQYRLFINIRQSNCNS